MKNTIVKHKHVSALILFLNLVTSLAFYCDLNVAYQSRMRQMLFRPPFIQDFTNLQSKFARDYFRTRKAPTSDAMQKDCNALISDLKIMQELQALVSPEETTISDWSKFIGYVDSIQTPNIKEFAKELLVASVVLEKNPNLKALTTQAYFKQKIDQLTQLVGKLVNYIRAAAPQRQAILKSMPTNLGPIFSHIKGEVTTLIAGFDKYATDPSIDEFPIPYPQYGDDILKALGDTFIPFMIEKRRISRTIGHLVDQLIDKGLLSRQQLEELGALAFKLYNDFQKQNPEEGINANDPYWAIHWRIKELLKEPEKVAER